MQQQQQEEEEDERPQEQNLEEDKPATVEAQSDSDIEEHCQLNWLEAWVRRESDINGYKCIRNIGQGGFGSVFLVENQQQEQFAMKMVAEANKKIAKALAEEIDLLKGLNHTNVVQIKESFTAHRLPFLVMEFCEQGSLHEYLHSKPHNRLESENEALQIFAQILNGFAYLHQNGIIHRDIKCQNILIHKGVFKIADFGISAKLERPNQIIGREYGGTRGHMAPEMLEGQVYYEQKKQKYDLEGSSYIAAHRAHYDYRVDLWSLGVVLFNMLYGCNSYPFGLSSKSARQLQVIRRLCYPEYRVEKSLAEESFVQQSAGNTLPKISPELQNVFTRIFKLELFERIEFEELATHPLISKFLQDAKALVLNFNAKFPKLSRMHSKYIMGMSSSLSSDGGSQNGIPLNSPPQLLLLQDQQQNESNQHHPQAENEQIRQQNERDMRFKRTLKLKSSSIVRLNGVAEAEPYNNAQKGKAAPAAAAAAVTQAKNTAQQQQSFKAQKVPFESMISRIVFLQMLEDELDQDGFLELVSEEATLAQFYIAKVARYYAQSVLHIMVDRENFFNIEGWATFINSQNFYEFRRTHEKEVDRQQQHYDILKAQVLQFSAEITDSELRAGLNVETALLPTDNIAKHLRDLPEELKLPYRGILLILIDCLLAVAQSKYREHKLRLDSKKQEHKSVHYAQTQQTTIQHGHTRSTQSFKQRQQNAGSAQSLPSQTSESRGSITPSSAMLINGNFSTQSVAVQANRSTQQFYNQGKKHFSSTDFESSSLQLQDALRRVRLCLKLAVAFWINRVYDVSKSAFLVQSFQEEMQRKQLPSGTQQFCDWVEKADYETLKKEIVTLFEKMLRRKERQSYFTKSNEFFESSVQKQDQ